MINNTDPPIDASHDIPGFGDFPKKKVPAQTYTADEQHPSPAVIHVPTAITEGDDRETIIFKLAQLPALDYDPIRKECAKKLQLKVSTLDAEVKKRRPPEETESGTFADVEPWPEPVVIGPLLDEIRETLNRYVVFQSGAETAIPLWLAGAYIYEPLRIFPKLMVVSPEKRCGKTTLLEVVSAMAPRSIMASGISSAVVYRMIEIHKPTLLIDEADTFLPNNPELHGIINSGHTRTGAKVWRCDGDNNEPREFSTWSPMVLAGIRLAGDTIIDRSVVIKLRRKTKNETVTSLPIDLETDLLSLRRKLKRWADDNAQLIAAKIVSGRSTILPDIGNDRALDNWTPLAAIAETAGGDWLKDCAEAFEGLTPKDEGEAIGTMLLEDIQAIFIKGGLEKIWSCNLVERLIEFEERPWPEWKHGKPMTVRSLANLLNSYGIKSAQIRDGFENKNGFRADQFAESFERYL